MDATKRCPYCDEEIRADAIRCRYCRSRLAPLDPGAWYRDHSERRVAGVASAVAQAFAIPVAAARFGFIVLATFHLVGLIAYLALWLIVPFRPGEEPPFARGLRLARRIGDELRDAFRRPAARPRPNGRDGDHDVPATGVPC
jgi:phage shock protein PspC (stress-responsive transcriptional regulator)